MLALFRGDAAFDVRDAAPATLEPILRVHPQAYLDSVRAFSLAGGGALTGDTTLNAQSWDAALGAAGAVLAATDLALTGRAPRVRRGPAAGAPRAARHGDGLLPREQRRGGRVRRARRRAASAC